MSSRYKGSRRTHKSHESNPYSGRQYPLYQYDPLPKGQGVIRLLEVLPSGRSDADVSCELVTPSHDEKLSTPYEALSWCWGTANKSEFIRVKQNKKTYSKYVTPDLLAALKALRYADRSRYLWIDMICIDQDNLVEKNHQVEMMDLVYGNAERVCIWLGEDSESSRIALRFIKNEVLPLQSFDSLCESKDASTKWAALLDLMQRPWFSRRWVVQELALAQKAVIYCGNERISWSKFAIAVELFIEIETATHRLSEVMKKGRQYQDIPSYFDHVTALGASLLVNATERSFRGHPEIQIIEDAAAFDQQAEPYTDSESDTSLEASDSEYGELSLLLTSNGMRSARTSLKHRIQPLLSLEYLVSSLTIFDTSVPHDSIYALLAIAKDTMPRDISHEAKLGLRVSQGDSEDQTRLRSYKVDYRLPYVDVCKDFVLFAIEQSLAGNQSRALDVICRPWATPESTLKRIRLNKKVKQEKRERDARREKDREMRRKWRETRGAQSPPFRLASLNVSRATFLDNEDEIAETEDMALPSWIPQLSSAPHAMAQRPGLTGLMMSRINADPLVGLPSLTERHYSAAETKSVDMKSLRFRKRVNLGHYSMYVRGFQLDIIKDVEQVAHNGHIPRGWVELARWEDARGNPPDAFWRTLVANRGKDGRNAPLYYSRACQESFKKGGLESGAIDTTALIEYERNSVVAQFCRRVQAVTWNRALVRTETGRLGLVGKDVKKNDLVCVLYGCSVPVVLRGSKRKAQDIFSAEMEQELIDIKNAVVKSFRRYMSRKRRHEARKDIKMALLCRRWSRATDYIRIHGFNHHVLTHDDISQELRRILSTAIQDFKMWLHQERTKQYSFQNKQSRKEMEALWHSELGKGRGHYAQRHSRISTSTNDLADYAAISGFSTGSANSSMTKLSPTATKQEPIMDWWAFELALAAGRRWRQIVRERRESRIDFALQRTQVDWFKQKRDEYKTFRELRMRDHEWLEVGSAAFEQDMSNGINNTTYKSAINHKDEKNNDRGSRNRSVNDIALEGNEEHADMNSEMVDDCEGDIESGDVEVPGTNGHIGISEASHSRSIPTDLLASSHSSLEVRPSWARRSMKTRLTLEERKEYDEKIRSNLRDRLGEEGWFSYKLLGECYIHGVMDGEAMLYQNEGDGKVIPSMVFEIR